MIDSFARYAQAADVCTRPLNYLVERAMHNFQVAVLPGKFGNRSTYWEEVAGRIVETALSVIALLPALTLNYIGKYLHSQADRFGIPYTLSGNYSPQSKEQEKRNDRLFLTFNLCMLPYGIASLGGLSSPVNRIDRIAKKILETDADFVCLQEIHFPYALQLWDAIENSYSVGFTRIGPMPSSGIGTSLFFASKYPVSETIYHPLTDPGPIARGVFAAKTETGWILNAHLSSDSPEVRKQQIREIADFCQELLEKERIPCFICLDSNIQRIGGKEDEYARSGIEEHFINTRNFLEPFVLSSETATYTACLGEEARGKPRPESISTAFEHVDYVLCYTPSFPGGTFTSSILPAFDLSDPENSLSDHQGVLVRRTPSSNR